MMLLGLVLHSAVFTATYAPVRTDLGEDLLYLSYDFIHTFRMPAFFFISGFFSALLFDRYGTGGLLSNRAKRILIPLLIFWPTVTIAFQLIFSLNNDGNVAPAEQDFIEFYHLWFLAYLFYTNLITVILVKLLPWLFSKPRKLLANKFIQVLLYVLASILLAVIPNTLETDGTIKTASAVLPNISMVGFYLVVFILGWICFFNQSMLTNFRKFWFLFLIVGIIGYFGHLATGEQLDFDYRLAYFGASLSLSFSILGIMLNLIKSHHPIISYLSQASYWIYLVHLPIVFLVLTFLDPYSFSIGLRFLLVLTITTLTSVASYHLMVRSRAIGRLLGEKPVS